MADEFVSFLGSLISNLVVGFISRVCELASDAISVWWGNDSWWLTGQDSPLRFWVISGIIEIRKKEETLGDEKKFGNDGVDLEEDCNWHMGVAHDGCVT